MHMPRKHGCLSEFGWRVLAVDGFELSARQRTCMFFWQRIDASIFGNMTAYLYCNLILICNLGALHLRADPRLLRMSPDTRRHQRV